MIEYIAGGAALAVAATLSFGAGLYANRQSAGALSDDDFQQFIQNINEGYYRSSLDGKQMFGNRALVRLNGYDTEQELLDAQANAISAQADEVIASYRVLAAMGLLTAEHLRLPVQIYDPAAYYNLVKDAPTVTSEQGQALDRVLRAIGQ